MARGTLTLPTLKAAIFASYGIALSAGCYLIAIAGPFVLLIGLLSIGASWMYSAGPWPVGRHGLADPLFFLFFGIVPVVGTYYVQAAPAAEETVATWIVLSALPSVVFLFGISIGASTTNILIIDDIRDYEFDVVKGKRTIAVRFGKQWSRAEFTVLLALAYLVPLWLALGFGYGASILLPLLTLPYAVALRNSIMKLDRHEDLIPMTPRAGRLLLAYSILLAIGTVLQVA